ncbi:MAG: 50S ribosomal protein L21 [Candidatus Neomarinimicrobiota bacterium]|nr:MAG: 50S ribosomal protein L21 [Candidatus Neomarinimicrobiota bacterium]
MYAIINISGKQYKATSGARLRVPKQDGETGTSLTFDKVLLINDGKNTEVGEPILKGASVTGTIIEHGRNKKILVYKKKRRKGYQRKNGHRQWFTEIEFGTIKAGKSKSVKKNNFNRCNSGGGRIKYGT